MLRPLLLLLLCAVSTAPARAGDFTGAYAGVNAGYGWSHERDNGIAPAVPPGAPATASSPPGLPPSATAAAATLRRQDRGTATR
ncbi:hypothetical protein [Methylobacterium persicinum]|uniref:Uncharacterized protein n=1 Tax=Methylobacterium persicinum TaxID=374426 RepID=A0ABU0HP09_9HYPH|nr:hypothetical protein [Methylobacterium persicinum]MDQ0444063.1 hypothetical protein [Methylobacterium persicinum]GJE38389.1 hypothetical protein KHHGKMAE_2461 [Methylobacterium persicinum]